MFRWHDLRLLAVFFCCLCVLNAGNKIFLFPDFSYTFFRWFGWLAAPYDVKLKIHVNKRRQCVQCTYQYPYPRNSPKHGIVAVVVGNMTIYGDDVCRIIYLSESTLYKQLYLFISYTQSTFYVLLSSVEYSSSCVPFEAEPILSFHGTVRFCINWRNFLTFSN